MGTRFFIAAILSTVLAGCATTIEGDPTFAGRGEPEPGRADTPDDEPGDDDPSEDPDATEPSDDGPPEDEEPTPEDPPADGATPISLQASASNTITPLNSISCNIGSPSFAHSDNFYLRTYDLPAAGITEELTVTSVDVGVEEAIGAGGSQAIVVSLFAVDGPLETGTISLLASTTALVEDQSAQLLNVPLSAVVPANRTLLVEVLSPDGQAAGNRFFMGSNAEPETSPSFIAAPDCGINNYIPTSQLGVAGLVMSYVLNVNAELGP